MNLPIELIPGTSPPKFRWRQTVTTPIGPITIDQEGLLPPAVDNAVGALITMTRQLLADNEALRKQIDGHVARIAAQSELLRKRAEAPVTVTPNKSRGT